MLGWPVHLSAKAPLRFSNTMEWNPEFLAYTEKTPQLLPDHWQGLITLSVPPANDAKETQVELVNMLSLVSSRDEHAAAILAERHVEEFVLGGIRYGDLMGSDKYPATKALMEAVYHDVGVVVFTLKQKFDRVRPSFLEPKLKPLIANPQHPAYPSGHSTCAHTFALVLGSLLPEQREQMWQDAGAIGLRREIAGVHYASDTSAGREVAKHIFTQMSKRAEYQQMLKLAQKEW